MKETQEEGSRSGRSRDVTEVVDWLIEKRKRKKNKVTEKNKSKQVSSDQSS